MSKITLYEGSAPDTPSSGTVVIYGKTDGTLAYKNDSGEEVAFDDLAGLSDVDISDKDDGHILVYNSETENWEAPYPLSAGEGITYSSGTISVDVDSDIQYNAHISSSVDDGSAAIEGENTSSSIDGLSAVRGYGGNTGDGRLSARIEDTTAFGDIDVAVAGIAEDGVAGYFEGDVNVDGEIIATGEITAHASDERLKDFQGKITGALDKLNKINGYYFQFNQFAESFGYKNKRRQVGVSAQQLQEVLPEIVKLAPFDRDKNGKSKSGEEYLTVSYEKIVPLLIEAIKEQQEDIKYLKEEIKVLKNCK